jgi:WS/DGAT/MGAT family acyltransferase
MREEKSTPIDRLSPLDRVMLGASRIWPQDIGALAVLDGAALLTRDGRLRIEAIREAVAARLHLVPRFRQLVSTPRRGLGGPLWVDDAAFDLTEHFHEHRVAPPGVEAQMIEAVVQLAQRPLDPSRPLWGMWFLTGLLDQQVGLLVRIHHAIADGMAAMITVATLLDAAPDQPVAPPSVWTPAPSPTARELFVDSQRRHLAGLAQTMSSLFHPRASLRRMRAAWPALRELVTEEPATATSLDRMVGPNRGLALIRGSLDAAKEIAHRSGATVNDVLLTITAGGLRALLQHRGEQIEGTTLRTYVPVSLRRRLDGPQQGNLIAQMVVPLRLGEPDPIRRLRDIAAETTRRKAKTHTSLDVMMQGRIVRGLLLQAVMRQRVNVTTASIPGPPMPLYLAGAPILEVFPMLPLIANEPLGVGVVSYAGGLYIGIAADGDAFPDLGVLADGVRADMEALGSSPECLVAGSTSDGASHDDRTSSL